MINHGKLEGVAYYQFGLMYGYSRDDRDKIIQKLMELNEIRLMNSSHEHTNTKELIRTAFTFETPEGRTRVATLMAIVGFSIAIFLQAITLGRTY